MTTDPWDEANGLSEQLDKDFPETVILVDTNPKVLGIFRRVDSGPSEYGPVPIVVLERQDGSECGVWLFHAVLRNQFAQQAPKVGEMVGIRFLGKRRGASGREYSNYRVAVVRNTESKDFDWSIISDEAAMADLSDGAAPATDAPPVVGDQPKGQPNPTAPVGASDHGW
jgi:hypothetical protein